ncbi:MAG: eukaryotic-like serine/threonine-protein kinase [Cryptosporangiaceae bacterium]|nr:eukaryotic-like serine/threonine-protein kinase [Cryptosporangiaceae bacterium]
MTETQGALLADRYRLLDQLGRGGMGVVWLARDEVFHRDVAVKEVLLPTEIAANEREHVIQRTLKEARVAARLSHPNVVKVYDVVRAGGRPWIVMELIRARSLTELIEENGPLPPQQVAKIGLQVLAALGAAHAAGINHRDVKPGNVLCGDDGRVVLTDFGIASLDGDNSSTSTGPLMGSPSYIAPERVRGRPASPSSDLWSLAATLYAAVEGRPPYDRDGVVPTVTAVVNENPDPYRLAGSLAPVLDRMFQKEPEHRPSAAQIRVMLRELAGPPNRREADPSSSSSLPVLPSSLPAVVPPAGATAPISLLSGAPAVPPVPPRNLAEVSYLDEDAPEHITGTFAPPGRAEDRQRTGKLVPVAAVALAVIMLLGGGVLGIKVLFRDRGAPNMGTPPAALEPSSSPNPEATQEGQVIVPAAGETTSPTSPPSSPAAAVKPNRPAPAPSRSAPTKSVPQPTTRPTPSPKPSPLPPPATPSPDPPSPTPSPPSTPSPSQPTAS